VSLNSKWFRGNETPDEKRQKEITVRNARHVLDLLSEVIEQEIRELSKTKFDDYDSPGYSLKRADKDGQVRAFDKILKLTKLELYEGA
jgi:hypothetical protein